MKCTVMSRKIELSRKGKRNGIFATVDSSDFDWLSRYQWFVGGHGRFVYAARTITKPRGKRAARSMARRWRLAKAIEREVVR